MSNIVVLITGTNRGIGFELTKQYLLDGCRVIATCRNIEQATDLVSLQERFVENLIIEPMDISSPETIQGLADKLDKRDIKIDLIISNAGYLDRENKSIYAIDYAAAEQSFKVNSVGPLYLVHCFLPLINQERLCKIIFISSAMGSLTLEQNVDWYGYRMSKAATNMLTVNLSQELGQNKIVVAAIHPGWVQTDMGGHSAAESIEDSTLGIMKVVNGLSINDTGHFYSFNGEILPF
ncbi:SDR family oxidoreductase [Paraglaciecola sp. MB-3u-78]|uniref:SDR family oxidoreductase n=1 Tax=Paraglaciecola sp. MB-3u-78 TaxID=2058332 RepID=UPI000C33264F|nr:SDR family oxidoreductase [Paraglaciecola sp. MB-3u-78]PKG93384.1 short-chain dehydrogenase [Paraglaciecola sp. MB-3u-78]